MLPSGFTPLSPSGGSSMHMESPRPRRTHKILLLLGPCYILFFLIGLFLLPSLTQPTSTSTIPNTNLNDQSVVCLKGGHEIQDVFPGPPWRTSQTVSSRLLLADSRMRVESHTVRGEDGKLYDDWIWMDVIDQVNVIPFVVPSLPSTTMNNDNINRFRAGHFRVFRQKKYGLSTESLAVCGGQIEMKKKEQPLEAAKRELDEEMSLIGSPSSWISLGSYRVNVNRGHGMVSCYLVLEATDKNGVNNNVNDEEFHIDELEHQSIVHLTVDEMEDAIFDHTFGEIKWQATASMALAYVKRKIEEEDQRLAGIMEKKAAKVIQPGDNNHPDHQTTKTTIQW